MSQAAPTLGLYLSIPFCRAKCSFCNFASGVGSDAAIARYVAQLCEELRDVRRWALEQDAVLPEKVDTVYFGGGTPSLLEPTQIQAIFHAIRQEFTVAADAEITLEAAPGQIEEAVLSQALRGGVNRISLGVQSFDDREVQAVGRSHTRTSCLDEFDRLRRSGVPNLGADLIAGLPYQTEESWRHTLDIATGAKLDHLSVYMLEIDDESRLGREVLGGGARLHAPAVASEDLATAFYEQACARLPDAGFAQYEISNFAQRGRQSRHNRRYWTRAPYLGFGLDAHSMLLSTEGEALRWANPDALADYGSALGSHKPERVGQRASFEETVFLGLRLADGLAWDLLADFKSDWVESLHAIVRELTRDGLMGWDDQRFWLTSRGRVLSGEVFGELLAGAYA